MKALLEQATPQLACLSGDLSFHTVRDVERQGVEFIRQAMSSCIIDLTGVTYSDSAGVALLLALYREAKAQGKGIHFTALPANMRSLLAVSSLDDLIPLR